MTDAMLNLARRAVACKSWRWMPGMLIHYTGLRCFDLPGFPPKLPEPQRARLLGDSPSASLLSGDPFPDLTDPATLGCLLALVRETYGEATAHTRPFKGRWLVEREDRPYLYDWLCSCGTWGEGNGHVVGGATEAEALVAALEAAP